MAKKTREMSAIERAFDAGWKARTAIYTEDSRIGYHEALGNYLRENEKTDNREAQIRKAIDLAREGKIFGWPDSSPDDAEYVFKLTTDEIVKKTMDNDD